MTGPVVAWSAAQLRAHADEVLEVYAEAMDVPLTAARSRRGVLLSHVEREGLRAVAVLDGERLVGTAYGYLGRPGQWWHDQVQGALREVEAEQWLDGAFEVCELHVRPEHHGEGLGRALLDALLDGPPAPTAVLTTPDHETRARGFYRAGGWVDLARDLRFPGDPRPFAVLGKELSPRTAGLLGSDQ